ncbi:unnamed protein product [Symbiodinium microadriaticum]|nr:unnamed protein product [Symbiodinium microadriaticum]
MDEMLTEKHKELTKAVEGTLRSLESLDSLADDVLNLVVSDVLTKFHHKLGVGAEDSVSDLLEDFKQKVVNQIVNEADQWRIPKSDVVIFPRNCRFFYQKGESTIVVIEEEPRRREVKFAGDLLGTSQPSRASLPFPYIVYVIHMRRTIVANAYIGWRSTPLMRTSDKLARPLLPNSHDNLDVCWGRSMNHPTGTSVAEICDSTIQQYWSSEFNGDLRTRWDERGLVSSKLNRIDRWVGEDNIFMMSLDYHQHGDPTVEEKIKSITGHVDEPDMAKIRDQLYDLANKHSEVLFSKIIRYFKRVKPERFYPKDVTALLKSTLEKCVRDYLDVFYVLQFEFNKMESRIKKEEGKVAIKRLVSGVAKRFKQEMLGEWGEETSDRTLRRYRAQIVRYGWKHAQKWCKWDKDGPVLMPDNTRMYYRKGDTEIVVKELPPQVRLMKFRGALAARSNTSEKLSASAMNEIHHFSLAIPYVVFIFKFRNGLFQEVRCAFSDRPLKRLEEQPLRPYLSNIDTNLSVCLGPSFNKKELIKDNIFQQASYVLSNFWQTAYSDEWSTHFWNTRKHFQDNDSRLAGLNAWQEASTENPLFVVEDVNWLKYNEDSFGDMIVRMFEDDMTNATVHEELYNSLVDNFLDDLKKSITTDLGNVQERINVGGLGSLIDELIEKVAMFPVLIYEEGMELPSEGTYFLVSGNGLWMHKDTGIVRAFVPVQNISVLPDLESTSQVGMNMPKLPAKHVYKIKKFFQEVVDRYHAESATILYYNKKTGDFKVQITDQNVSHGGVAYRRVGTTHLEGYEDYLRVGTIHSHCDFNAFHSGTDIGDEEDFDGLHCTFGHNDKRVFSITASIVVNGHRLQVDPSTVLDGIEFERTEFFTLHQPSEETLDEWDRDKDRWLSHVNGRPRNGWGVPFIREPRVATIDVGDQVSWAGDLKTVSLKTIMGSGPFQVLERKDGKLILNTEAGRAALSEKLFNKEV